MNRKGQIYRGNIEVYTSHGDSEANPHQEQSYQAKRRHLHANLRSSESLGRYSGWRGKPCCVTELRQNSGTPMDAA